MNKLCWTTLLAVLLAGTSQAQDGQVEKGFTSLFDGKTLNGWHTMNGGKFAVKDKVILLNRGRGWLRSDKKYKDFELRMDFRFVSKGADSGIFVRAGMKGGNWPAQAYQVQTMDNRSLGRIFPAGLSRPKVKFLSSKLKEVQKKTGEWQSYVFIAKGGNLEVKLNGTTITTATGLADQAGYLGLQGEGGILEFKNIRIQVLD